MNSTIGCQGLKIERNTNPENGIIEMIQSKHQRETLNNTYTYLEGEI